MTRAQRLAALALAALACLAAAGVLAALAFDVLRWRGQLESVDVRFAGAPGEPRTWKPDSVLPGGVSRRLLDVDDDVAFREALQRYRLARPNQPAQNQEDVARRSQADLLLADVVAHDPRRVVRSRAATLRGTLAFEEARQSTGRVASLLQRTLDQFRDAIRLDPANENAKYDLELVLSLIRQADEEAEGQGEGRRRQSSGGQGSGAGSSRSSSGY